MQLWLCRCGLDQLQLVVARGVFGAFVCKTPMCCVLARCVLTGRRGCKGRKRWGGNVHVDLERSRLTAGTSSLAVAFGLVVSWVWRLRLRRRRVPQWTLTNQRQTNILLQGKGTDSIARRRRRRHERARSPLPAWTMGPWTKQAWEPVVCPACVSRSQKRHDCRRGGLVTCSQPHQKRPSVLSSAEARGSSCNINRQHFQDSEPTQR